MNWMRRSIAYSRDENEADAMRMAAMLRSLDELPIPTIARVNGASLGGGMGLLACCDIAVAWTRRSSGSPRRGWGSRRL